MLNYLVLCLNNFWILLFAISYLHIFILHMFHSRKFFMFYAGIRSFKFNHHLWFWRIFQACSSSLLFSITKFYRLSFRFVLLSFTTEFRPFWIITRELVYLWQGLDVQDVFLQGPRSSYLHGFQTLPDLNPGDIFSMVGPLHKNGVFLKLRFSTKKSRGPASSRK